MSNRTSQTTSWKIPDWAYLKRTLSTIISPHISFGNRSFRIEFNLETIDFGVTYCKYNKMNDLFGKLMIVARDGNRKLIFSFTNKFSKYVPHYLNFMKYYLPVTQFEREFVVDDRVEIICEFEMIDFMKSDLNLVPIHTHANSILNNVRKRNVDFTPFSPQALKYLIRYIYNQDVVVPDYLRDQVEELARMLVEPRLLEILARDVSADIREFIGSKESLQGGIDRSANEE